MIRVGRAATRLAYLTSTYALDGSARVISCGTAPPSTGENTAPPGGGPDLVILDETLFYPQGGGQPADTGIMSINETHDDDAIAFRVTHVSLDRSTGEVHHYGHMLREIQPGQKLSLRVDAERRLLNARMHTAGHLLFGVVKRIGLPLLERKGYHWPRGSFVEFEGVIDKPSIPTTIEVLNEAIEAAISDPDGKVTVRLAGDDGKEDGLDVQQGKDARIVTISGFEGSPCGGTHVAKLAELGSVRVTKIACKKGLTKINYAVQPPPAAS